MSRPLLKVLVKTVSFLAPAVLSLSPTALPVLLTTFCETTSASLVRAASTETKAFASPATRPLPTARNARSLPPTVPPVLNPSTSPTGLVPSPARLAS